MPEQLPPDDPITSRPMAGLILISVFILMLTVSWSLYDEFYGLRPWRKYQGEFSSERRAVSAQVAGWDKISCSV